MSRFDNYGALDTRVISGGDTFFQGVNNRLRPDQLQPGVLAYSQNGRMNVDGAWQTRKGIESFGQVLSSNTTALTLPFYLYPDYTISAASRVNDVVTVNLADIGTIVEEDTGTSEHGIYRNMSVVAGTWYTVSVYAKQQTRSTVQINADIGGVFHFAYAGFDLNAGTTLGAWDVFGPSGVAQARISAANNGYYRCFLSFQAQTTASIEITIRAALGFPGGFSYLGNGLVSGAIYLWAAQFEEGRVAEAQARRYEPTGATAGVLNQFTYSEDLSNAAWTAVGATITDDSIGGPCPFEDSSVVLISDISGTVDPTGNRSITASGSGFTFTIPGATGSESYVLGGSPIAGSPRLEQNSNANYGSCLFSDPSDDNAEYIIEAQYEKAVAISLADGTATDIEYPTGILITEPVNMIQAFSKVLIFRDGATALEWDGDLSGTPAFTKVENGDYAANVYLDANSNTVIANGVVTVSETGHGLSVGDRIYVIDKGTSTLIEDNGGYVVATVPNANSFTFYAEVADVSAHKVVYSRKVSSGRGFTHMPAPAWGVYHQRRLIVPFFYTTTGTSGSEVIASRDIKDEILFSDVLDSDTYDQLQNQFKVSAGIADYLQYVHPFTDDNAVAFNRNSIHLISGLSGSLNDLSIKEITREAGLVARRSVVTIGNRIFFLSDNGVYATEFGDLYNLRGAGLPLSDPIDPIIKRINPEYAQNAIAVYHDNRYWIAVPLDNSTVNNTILVFNLLNGAWESVDTISSDSWDIQNLIVAGAGEVNKLYAVNRFGGIHILDYREDDVDRLALFPGQNPATYAISSYATTRQYSLGTAERKKFNSFAMHVESSETNASNGTISVETENVDSDVQLGTVSGYLGAVLPVSEDAEIRGRIGNLRAYGLQTTFTPTQGRPKLRMVKVDAIPTFRAITQAS